MLMMNNGRPETILSPKDFEDLIDKYMGLESANYYQNQIEQLTSLIKELAEGYADDKFYLREVEEVLKKYGY
jgi:hypothetical protein